MDVSQLKKINDELERIEQISLNAERSEMTCPQVFTDIYKSVETIKINIRGNTNDKQ